MLGECRRIRVHDVPDIERLRQSTRDNRLGPVIEGRVAGEAASRSSSVNLAGSIKSKMRIAPLLPPGPEETLTIVSLARSPPCAPLLSPSARVRELQRYSMPSSLTILDRYCGNM